ncbi:Translation machinery-associated protein 20 [Tolypocladium capitatum]|uniref:Translation machinery-associated protein 20 n=1 Tax=Tolypocladium capitatum TaxID=45235 RepID=A0A2K3QC90_9HYPO|nr:Translation machinery-associated protein 20 [Tolypocladium capitatum]
MPLVVPGITSAPNKTDEWRNKLVGKKFSDTESNETASCPMFCKKDLPEQHRIISPGTLVTKDYNENRLNVHLNEDGTVSHPAVDMFKKDIPAAPKQKLKSSVQRSIRQSILSTYPLLTPYIDEILPKKASLASMKLPDRNTLYVLDAEPLFYQHDAATTILPHLRLVHRFPQGFPTIRIDRGAIRFVVSGATLMAPGLTSKGGRLPVAGAAKTLEEGREMEQRADAEGRWSRELAKGEPVVIMAEGKVEACAVGTLVVGTDEVKAKGKGPVVEDAHFLGDGLWNLGVE